MEEGEEEGGVVMEGWECYIEDTIVVEVAQELLVCTILYFNFLSPTPLPALPPPCNTSVAFPLGRLYIDVKMKFKLMQELCGLNVFNCLKNSCTLPHLQFFHQRKKKIKEISNTYLVITQKCQLKCNWSALLTCDRSNCQKSGQLS